MSGRQSAACAFALDLVERGVSIRQAAMRAGVAYSTAWRALKRQEMATMAAQHKAVFAVLGTHEELRRDQKLRAKGIKPRPLLGQLPEDE